MAGISGGGRLSCPGSRPPVGASRVTHTRYQLPGVGRETAAVNRPHPAWLLGVWGGATALALLFAHTTRVGPAVHLWASHGVHLGDLGAFAISYAGATSLTLRRHSAEVPAAEGAHVDGRRGTTRSTESGHTR